MGITLKRGDVVFFDTAPFIYFFEKNPSYFDILQAFFDKVYGLDIQLITSMITYIELTTHPARHGHQRLVAKYRDYLSNSENISLLPLDLITADQVVRLRAEYGYKTPDAIQLATAIICGADYIITNDKQWKKFHETKVIMVEDLMI